MITFNCQQCGTTLRVSDDKAGREGKCPQCKNPMIVPAAPPQPGMPSITGAKSRYGTGTKIAFGGLALGGLALVVFVLWAFLSRDAAEPMTSTSTPDAGKPPVKPPQGPLETPLGTVSKVMVAMGEDRKGGWDKKPKPGRAFVLVEITTRKRCPVTSIEDWAVVEANGQRHGVVALITKDGTVTGVKSMGAKASPDEPIKTTFVFEVPAAAKNQLDFYIDQQRLGRLVQPRR